MNEACYYRVSIKGIVIDSTGRFLLTREADGRWELLGGGLEHGEDPIHGIKRELHEETGLEVTWISPSPLYFVTVKRQGQGHTTFIANVIYEIKLESLDFKPSDECQELRFFNVEEARKEHLRPNIEKFLQVYNPNLHI